MTSISVAPPLGVRDPGRKAGSLDKLPDEMNEMKLRDDKVWGLCLYLSSYRSLFGWIVE